MYLERRRKTVDFDQNPASSKRCLKNLKKNKRRWDTFQASRFQRCGVSSCIQTNSVKLVLKLCQSVHVITTIAGCKRMTMNDVG